MDTENRRHADGTADRPTPRSTDKAESSQGKQKRKRAAKLFHKKSRTGCQRCRARRVKCNEAKPICHNCERLELSCVYDRTKPEHARAKSEKYPDPEKLCLPYGDLEDPEECESRRKLELQLFGHYITETGPSIAVDRIAYDFWVTVLCQMAFKSDALLYAVYFMTALHISRLDGGQDVHTMTVSHNYLKLAIREHQKEVKQLRPENVDIVCLTSSVFRVYSFITLQERSLRPYTPPVEWLRVTCSTTEIFRNAFDLVKDDPDSAFVRVLNTVPILLDDEARTAAQYRQGLLHLLSRYHFHEMAEEWNDDVQAAYESTLSYIGGVWTDMNNHDPPGFIGRRLILFPLFVEKTFVDMVEEGRPRALVILAYYFALLAMLRGYWWIGDIGQREVRAIAEVVPAQWRPMMAWPMQILGEEIIFTGES